MPDPILISHKGKLVSLYPDGRMADYSTGQPVKNDPDKRPPPPPPRWHDPY